MLGLGGPLHLARTLSEATLLCPVRVRLEACFGPVELHDQRGAGVDGVASGKDARLQCADRGLVHDLDRGGHETRCHDRGHRTPRVLHGLEDAEQGADALS